MQLLSGAESFLRGLRVLKGQKQTLAFKNAELEVFATSLPGQAIRKESSEEQCFSNTPSSTT